MAVSFIDGGNRITRKITPTCRESLPNFITQSCIEYTSPWAAYELKTLVVIGTDCIGSCKSNYHTITTTTAPKNTSNISQTCESIILWENPESEKEHSGLHLENKTIYMHICNTYVQFAIKSVHLYFIPYFITILCSIFYSNKLVTYILWSLTKTINFLRCLWLIDIKSVIILCVIGVVYNQHILPS